jgi:predicted 3-demethylubiquinone-9 3-methyltransferase (glyoxalase superfamily)
MSKGVTPFLWFDTQAEEAARFYVSVFPNSKLVGVTHYGEAGPRPAGSVLTASFEINGLTFVALNAGPEFTFSPAISFQIDCETQDEVDHLWQKLTEGGGEEWDCGWVKDKYGVSWQITPTVLGKMLSDPDFAKAQRAMKAMLTMKKLDIAKLQAAYEGK